MNLDFGTVSERDMDMLFLNLFGIDKEILMLFTDKTDFPEDNFKVKEIILSKSDKDGESDITVILEANNTRYGLLIEDKIDAIAMPQQPERYLKRGENGIKNKEYDVFYSFIVCPQKYYDNNEAAKKYPYAVMYEEIRDYLSEKEEPVYGIYYKQICQAIKKAKRPPKVEIDANANRFFRAYKDYQEENYPKLNLTTSRKDNGYWAHYKIKRNSVYLYHKIGEGKVDLTFNRASNHIDELQVIAEWLGNHGIENVSAKVTGNSGALRIMVPKLNMQTMFEENDEGDIEKCFKAISELIEVATIFEIAASISDL